MIKRFTNTGLIVFFVFGALAASWSCSSTVQQAETKQEPNHELDFNAAEVTAAPFGTLPDGKAVQLFTLKNSKGTEVKISSYGGIIVSIMVPDKTGKMEDVVLGYDSLSGYLSRANPYFGTIVGRFANRIAGGRFTLEGQQYQLDPNFRPNHMHGGNKGFDKVVWQAKEFKGDEGVGVRLQYTSPDGEEGYPGNLSTEVVYTLTEDNALKIDYQATTDKPTILNLTNHSYFNLTGNAKRDVLDHVLMIDADSMVPVNQNLIPTGQLKAVAGTPFDFNQPTAVGTRIAENDEQLKFGNGYDHSWAFANKDGLQLVASVYEPQSGRFMEVFTTEPGMQIYTANYLNGTGKGEANYKPRYAICLETQHFPDSPNQPNFPSVVLKPGESFQSTTSYRFSVK